AHIYAGLSLCGNTPHMFFSFGVAEQLVLLSYTQTESIPAGMRPVTFFNTLAGFLGYRVDEQKLYEAICAAFPDHSAVAAFPASGTSKALMDFLWRNRSLLDTDPLFVQNLSPFFRSYFTPALSADRPVL
ncbi:MAG: hypothetical protein Q4G07_09920, partial [Oscillospiraceae bacterium]|nr:hypothetical protein [Oscillospiraceae bacterium]